RPRRDHLEPRDVSEGRLDALRVIEGAVDASAPGGPDHHRHVEVAGGAVAEARRLLDDLVHGRRDEIGELDLSDWAHPIDRRADRNPHDAGFRERRVDHPELAVFLVETVTGQADAATIADVFPDQKDARVTRHLLVHALSDRLDDGLDG